MGSDHCQLPSQSYTLTDVLQSVLPEGRAEAYKDLDLGEHPNIHRIARVACSDLKLFGAPNGQDWDLKKELRVFHLRRRCILLAVDELERLSHLGENMENAASAFLGGTYDAFFQEELEPEESGLGVYIKHQCPSPGCGRLF
jgi:hypothetical protein